MKDTSTLWLAGSFIIAITIAGFGTYAQHGRNVQIEECEKLLPRNKHCILIAVPQDEEEELDK